MTDSRGGAGLELNATARTYVITGAASGIGRATKQLLEERGHRVIGVDLHDADVLVDLATADGRARMVSQVADKSGGSVDGILAVAGLAPPILATVAVNYFGMVATLEGLRTLLTGSAAPGAAGVSSTASLMSVDDELVALLVAGDEPAAMARAEVLVADPAGTGRLIYASTKKAFCLWIRRNAAGSKWAGESIPLNAVAPGVTDTPMVAALIDTSEKRAEFLQRAPMPLNGIAKPVVVARLLAWLTSEENTHLCGQVVFVDGGGEVLTRGDSTW